MGKKNFELMEKRLKRKKQGNLFSEWIKELFKAQNFRETGSNK